MPAGPGHPFGSVAIAGFTRSGRRLVRAAQVAGGLWVGAWLILVLAHAFTPVGLIFAFGQLVAAVPPVARDGLDSPAGTQALVATALVGAALLLSNAAAVAARAFDELVGRRLEAGLQARVIAAVNRPSGIAHLEDPTLRASIALAREVETAVHPPRAAVRALHSAMTGGLQGLAAGIVLAGFRWWAPFVIAAGWALQDLWGHLNSGTLSSLRPTEDMRRYEYLRSLAFDPGAAKEVRVFALGTWLAARAEAHWQAGMARIWRSRQFPGWLVLAIIVVMIVGHVLVLDSVVGAGAAREITIAQVAIYLQLAFTQGISLLQPYSYMVLRNAAPPVRHALELDAYLQAEASRRTLPTAGLPRVEMRFQSVVFAYPGTERRVFDGLELAIPAGRSTAIVGQNGAGKTTLVKLLAGLYGPDEGQICIDGNELRDLDADGWRQRMAVLFQDYVRYPLTLRENIALGTGPVDEDALQRVAAEVGIDLLARRLDRGWETPLSPEFGGVDLSGGQWQRVGLARALYAVERGATLLVLDEPTASLDVREEARFYDRFLDLTRGLTTILISHRFSSVRHADQICVIENGRLAESGSHAELLARRGRYATLFELQASPYRRGRAGGTPARQTPELADA